MRELYRLQFRAKKQCLGPILPTTLGFWLTEPPELQEEAQKKLFLDQFSLGEVKNQQLAHILELELYL